ncbi:hypothetical protein Rhopal_000870-T1 [Rhodotorula paludigena]|uniref:Csf1 N-terminal domain-containing protein n=1 Tax=Rhodotorula paludigena TaxID=86838 RepID=A0AAV5GE43_9BASI|nr:hypothetical protein Rhopal_000870-T1 [Rhodotorula paludigena]
MAIVHLAWAVALFKGDFHTQDLKMSAKGTERDELGLMARFLEFAAYYAVLETCLCVGAIGVCVWPQRETAKWLSRLLWIGWMCTWALGIFGIVAYISSDAFIRAGCETGEECWASRKRLRIWLMVGLAATLAINFYCSVILSAFVHTLHPHLFRSADSDTEDDFSDYEAELLETLEAELADSKHPLAAHALVTLAEHRRAAASNAPGQSARSLSRRRSGWHGHEDEAGLYDPPPMQPVLRSEQARVAQSHDSFSDDSDAHSISSEEEDHSSLMRETSARRGRLEVRRGFAAPAPSDVSNSEDEYPPSYLRHRAAMPWQHAWPHLVARASAVNDLRGSGPASLNWLFLTEAVAVFLLVLFYFFYMNRVFGLLVSWILRLFLWKSSNAYFTIGSVKLSLLGGRIQFNDFRYISRNQSLRVVRGSVTWKYWLRHVRSEEDKPSESRTPCRVQVSISGAEWYLYNRTPSYDAILEQLGLQEQKPLRRATSDPSSETSPASDSLLKGEKVTPVPSPSTAASSIEQIHAEEGRKEQQRRREMAEGKRNKTNWLLEALPIAVSCGRGAIVMGNPSTPTILITGFDGVEGTYSAGKTRSALDSFKQVYSFNFRNPKVVWRTNPDYEEGMADHGAMLMDNLDETIEHFSIINLLQRPTDFLSLAGFRDLVSRKTRPSRRERKRAQSTTPRQSPGSSKSASWAGLPRYQSTEDDPTAVKEKPPQLVDYAKVATLLEAKEIEMTYYSDVAGLVPEDGHARARVAGLETHDVGNGDLSPEWGVDLVVHGASVTYGPWADRQRAKIQSAFLPATYFNGLETPRLKPGDQRLHTALKVLVEFSDGATVRIPTREPSKDWKYDTTDGAENSKVHERRYGWLDITLGPNSTLTYVLPMVATNAGYDTLLELHLDDLNVASSVNHETFLHADACRVHCGLPSPLVWDERRTWTITTKIARPDISLLRDHITLFTDVAKDWTSGPPGDYDHFVPFLYEMHLEVTDYAIQLYLNDHNIINNPTAVEDNALLTLSGPAIDARVAIPSDAYRQECTNIQFTTDARDLCLSMSLPEWNTHSAFMTDRTRTFASTPELSLDGSYRFYSSAQPDNVEKLTLNIRLKENYFGNFTHYVTFDEYKRRHNNNLQGDPVELKYRPGKTDAFEVSVTFELENGLLLLPQEIFDCRSAVVLALPQLQVDLRNHDFFMEMSLNVEPFRILETSDATRLLALDFVDVFHEQTDYVRVDGLEICANRLFGPQPRTATYMCVWSIILGDLVGSVPPSFIQSLARAGKAVGLTFSDSDNAPAPDYTVPLDPDATVLTVKVDSFDLAVRGQTTAVQTYLPRGLDLRFDDLASAPFLKHLRVDVPDLTVRALAPLFGRAAPWMEVVSVDADLSLVLGLSRSGWETRAREQLAFIALQDSLTKRCPFVYGQGAGCFHRAEHPQTRGILERVEEESESDALSSLAAVEIESASSDDDAYEVYARLPGRGEANDRFSAYGAVLRLCERAPERAFDDRPTFRRLRRDDQADAESRHTARAASTRDRLGHFAGSKSETRRSTSKSCMDISSTRGLRFVLTPVGVQVASDVLEGVQLDTDFEHCLDDLYHTFLARQRTIPKLRYTSFEIAASLPLVKVDLIQDVLRPEEVISLHQRDNVDVEGSGGATVLCTVQLVIEDVKLGYKELMDGYGGVDRPLEPCATLIVERKVDASSSRARLQVFHPEESNFDTARRNHALPRFGNMPRARATALDLVLGPGEAHIEISASRALASLVGGEANLDFVDEAAELLIGAIWSWRVVSDFLAPFSRRAADARAYLSHLVYAIAAVSDAEGITAIPVFLNRVSYLVGSSSTLRMDDTWKVLHNLRHCERIGSDRLPDMMASSSWPEPHQLREAFLKVLREQPAWGIDVDDYENSTFLSSLYGGEGDTAPSAPDSEGGGVEWLLAIPIAVEVESGDFVARFWHDLQTANRLAVGKISAFVATSGLDNEADEVRLRARATLDSLDARIERNLLVLIRHILGVRRTFEDKIQRFTRDLAASAGSEPRSPRPHPDDLFAALPAVAVDASVSVRHIGAIADADELEAEVLITDATTAWFGRMRPLFSSEGLISAHAIQHSASFAIGDVSVVARDTGASQDQTLFAASADGPSAVLSAGGRRETQGAGSVDTVQALFAIQTLRFQLLRDAVRFYRFVENWKASSLPVYDSLLTDLRQGLEDLPAPPTPRSITVASKTNSRDLARLFLRTDFRLQAAISTVEFAAQAIPTLKAFYTIHGVSAFGQTSGAPGPNVILGEVDVGLQIGGQTVRFVPVFAAPAEARALPSETAFNLPIVRVNARLDAVPVHHVRLLATVDPITVKLTTAVIDNVLTVQSHFGNDLDELITVIRDKHVHVAPTGHAETLPGAPPAGALAPVAMSWEARLALRGVQIAIEGPQAVQWIEAELIEGQASSDQAGAQAGKLRWQASVQNLALSLAQRVTLSKESTANPLSDRRYRLAFFRLNLNASNSEINLPELPSLTTSTENDTPHLHLRLPRVHAVVQPNAIEALGDLVDHFESEIQERRRTRKQELDALHSRVVQSLDMTDDGAAKPSWLSTCVLSVEAQNVGVAIPLSDEGVAGAAATRRKRETKAMSGQSRPAFLLSIPSIRFAAQKGSAGYARISRFAVQFVPDFDQGRKEDFDGSKHPSLNRVLLPDMQCTLRSPHGEPALVHSKVSGLEIDLEPSIVAYSFALVDVYRLSHERFAKFAPEPPSGTGSPPMDGESNGKPRQAPRCTPSTSSTMLATFEFASGAIRMHSSLPVDGTKASSPATPMSRPKAHRRGKSLGEFATMRHSPGKVVVEPAPDVFRLPALSVWAEYRDDEDDGDSRLHVDSVIHKSHNTLYPSLLPFVSSVVQHIKDRSLPSASVGASPTSALSPVLEQSDHPSPAAAASSGSTASPTKSLGHLRLTISLRIDQSKLDISCLPAAEVTAWLTWESGGFFFATTPESKGFTFAVSVDGVAAGLRHLFSPEDCLSASAKGLAASLSLGQLDAAGPRLLSIVVDLPDVSAGMNFRHLQDWLCLKAVWLDRIDLGTSPPSAADIPSRPTRSTAADSASSEELNTAIHVQVGRFEFRVDLGPSIGRSTLVANRLETRLRIIAARSREFSFDLGDIEATGQGRAGGALQIEIKLGKVDASVKYEFHHILALEADPVLVTVLDDWSCARQQNPELALRFEVKGGSFNLLGTTATIPTLFGVTRRVKTLVEEKTASATAVLAAAGVQQPRPTSQGKAATAISNVASTLNRSLANEGNCPVRIVSRLEIALDNIRLAIFQDHWNDGIVFQADAGESIRAELQRGVDRHDTVQRNLHLHLGLFRIRKITPRKLSPSDESNYSVTDWYALLASSSERSIFKIGATDVKMDSEQPVGTYRVKHRFSMLFGGHVDIALNYALLRNLATLATQYRMQMERVTGVADSSAPLPRAPVDPESSLVPPPASVGNEVATGTILDSEIPRLDHEVVKMKPLPLMQAVKQERPTLQFEAVEMDVHSPQLQYLGDGLQRSRFPAFVHTGVTAPLEELLIMLSSTYGSQLAKNKFRKRSSTSAAQDPPISPSSPSHSHP